MLSFAPIQACSFVFAAILVNYVSAQAGVSTCGRRIAPLAGVKCGARGTVARPQIITDIIAPVPETQQQLLRDCQDACLDRGRVCKAWFINAKTNRCRLFSATIESMGFTADNNANSPLFYSKDCVDGECYTTYDTQLTDDGQSYDDSSFQVCPPGGLKFYNTFYNCAQMSTNGVLSFGTNAAANTGFINGAIPTSSLPPTSLAVFWDDLMLDPTSTRVFPEHSLSWSQERLSPDRKTTFTWKARIPDSSITKWIWVSAIFTQNSNRIMVKYNHLANDFGQGATIGAQNFNGQSMLVSYNTFSLNSGNSVTFDTGSNTYNLCVAPSGC